MSDLVAGPRTARWTATATEGVYRFQVNRADEIPVDPVDPDRRAWHWHLQFCPADSGDDGQNVHVRSTTADVIWAPAQHDSVRVLASLASFLSAWDEAVRYGGNDSENRGLFPDAALPVLGAVDDFAGDMDVTEMLGIVAGIIHEIATGNSDAQSAQ
jgi:subtilisin family serine protease